MMVTTLDNAITIQAHSGNRTIALVLLTWKWRPPHISLTYPGALCFITLSAHRQARRMQPDLEETLRRPQTRAMFDHYLTVHGEQHWVKRASSAFHLVQNADFLIIFLGSMCRSKWILSKLEASRHLWLWEALPVASWATSLVCPEWHSFPGWPIDLETFHLLPCGQQSPMTLLWQVSCWASWTLNPAVWVQISMGFCC